MSNPVLSDAVVNLRSAYRKNKAPLWIAVAEMIQQPGSTRTEVNLSKIARHTQKGSVVIVPGKVLGSGSIDHEITLCAFSLSQNAARKVIDAGGKVMGIREFLKMFPDGSGVNIIA